MTIDELLKAYVADQPADRRQDVEFAVATIRRAVNDRADELMAERVEPGSPDVLRSLDEAWLNDVLLVAEQRGSSYLAADDERTTFASVIAELSGRA